MLDKLFKKKEKDPIKEKERLNLSVLISATLFLFGILLLTLISCTKK